MKKHPWARPGVWLPLGIALVPIAVVFLLLAGRDLGGQTPVTPDQAAIIGVWINADGATLDFAPDGKVTASRMPVVDDPDTDFDVLPHNGSGTWQIDPWDSGAGSGGGVDLVIGNSGSGWLITTGDPAHPNLFAGIGDPDDDNDFTFTKQS